MDDLQPRMAFTKSEAGGVGGAVAILLVWSGQQLGVEFGVLEGMALSTLVSYVFAYLRSTPAP